MRNTQKWLVLLLTVVMLVNVLGVSAMAAENEAPLALEFHSAAEGGMLQVDILATESQIVADGKLVVTYDSAALTYEGTEVGTAWTDAEAVTLSDNAKDGKVILAFACADPAAEGVLFSIRFSGAVGDARIALDADGSYISGTSQVPAIGGEYCPSSRFTDVAGLSEESHAALDYMVANGYIKGVTETQFSPYTKLTRSMIVAILHRAVGSPEAEGTLAFTDVPANEYYTEAVRWAVQNGITNGVTQTKFAPDRALSRQELVTFLYRFAGYMGYDRTASDDLSAFTDAGTVESFAVVPFQWAVAEGIIKGTDESTLNPLVTTTREQVVLVVYRLLSQQD